MVVPLPKQGHHVRELSVADHTFVGCIEDVVGHLSHLRVEERADFIIKTELKYIIQAGASDFKVIPAGARSC